ncbi:MAG: PaaX family transcriptional regulator [Acidimicrobiales bacterium]
MTTVPPAGPPASLAAGAGQSTPAPAVDPSMKPRAGSSAKSLLLTILGEFVLPRHGSAWTSTIVRALGALGVEERNARQALFRLAERGFVRSEKEGRRARWHLTGQGTRLLTAGTHRIYEFGRCDDTWDGRWLVILCFVAEEQRTKRHQLRAQLSFAGFGFLAPGVAVSPHLHQEAEAHSALKELGLLPGAVVLRAETGELIDADELLRRAWDLDDLSSRYQEFQAEFAPLAPVSDEGRFAGVVELVHAWRRFPFIDPEIPPRLLPPDWPGCTAKELFDSRHATWAPGARAWYDSAESAGA